MKSELGINFHGFFKDTSGIAQASRMNSLAMKKAGIEISFNNYYYQKKEIIKDTEIHEYNSVSNEFNINLFQINLNSLNDFFSTTTTDILNNKYNIAYWAWEFNEIPDEILPFLNVFDEIWVPSNFCVEAFSLISPIPVIKISHPIATLTKDEFSKIDFGINNEDFIFLTIFDSISTIERKNPFGVIEAFLKAFPNDENVVLIVKTFNLHKNKKLHAKFTKLIENNSKIKLIDENFEKEKLDSLIKNSDALVSLHRAEGFGLTMAEAMSYGKPVIATAYSGNLDYMNINNSFLVKHGYMELSEDCGILKKGYVMAEPNVDDAVNLMSYVFENKNLAADIGEIAKKQITSQLSFNTIGNQIKKRLVIIKDNFLTKEKTSNNKQELLIIENSVLKEKINYLEKTLYTKIRKKLNKFFSK